MKRKEIVALVQEKAKWWVKWLGLGYWDISFQFGEGKPEGKYSEYLVGLSEPIWQYQTATITFYPKNMKHMTADEIEKLVVHELMHVFLNEMREEGIDHEERVATMLSKAFIWTREAVR